MFYQFSHLASPDYLKIERGCDFSFQPHMHQCFEIIMICAGEMRITVDGYDFLLNKGQAVLIFPNQIHALHSDKSEHMLCIFSPRLVQAYASRVTDKVPRDNRFWPDEYLMRALEGMEDASDTVEKKGVLYSLCGQFDKTARYKTRRADSQNLLYRIFSFVEKEFAGDCSLTELADRIGYDYSYLSRYFKKTVGISFHSYVNHYRLSYACYLMENSDRSILRCALESGYISIRSFNRNFKEQFGITPAQYRKRI